MQEVSCWSQMTSGYFTRLVYPLLCIVRLLLLLSCLHILHRITEETRVDKGKVFAYSLLSVGPGADPGVQAVSSQVALGHPPGSRLLLLSARPAVTFPAKDCHCPSDSNKLYCLVAGTCMSAACWKLLPGSGLAKIWTRNLLGRERSNVMPFKPHIEQIIPWISRLWVKNNWESLTVVVNCYLFISHVI